MGEGFHECGSVPRISKPFFSREFFSPSEHELMTPGSTPSEGPMLPACAGHVVSQECD